MDHFYWEYGGAGSPQNYVEAALSAGHAIFTFDRLGTFSIMDFPSFIHIEKHTGTSQSSQPDGIKEVQTSTEIAVLAQLIYYLRAGVQGCTFDRIVAVGHSYGRY